MVVPRITTSATMAVTINALFFSLVGLGISSQLRINEKKMAIDWF
jgi:hypothetical protein